MEATCKPAHRANGGEFGAGRGGGEKMAAIPSVSGGTGTGVGRRRRPRARRDVAAPAAAAPRAACGLAPPPPSSSCAESTGARSRYEARPRATPRLLSVWQPALTNSVVASRCQLTTWGSRDKSTPLRSTESEPKSNLLLNG